MLSRHENSLNALKEHDSHEEQPKKVFDQIEF